MFIALNESQLVPSQRKCKLHNYEHFYVRHVCGHEYCSKVWRCCPRCYGTEPENRVNSADYELALQKHNEAIRVFTAARTAYRNQTISDNEFLTAKAIYDKATAEFDVAFAKEQNR